MRAKLHTVLMASAFVGILFLAMGGSSSAVNPVPNFLDRLVNGDSDAENSELANFACVEDVFESFPERTVFRPDIDDLYYLQRTIEIGFPRAYFDEDRAQYSLTLEQRPSNPSSLLTFPCPDFDVVIDDLD